ncbi:MAG: chemotaxis protein CheC [Clostridiales bacterium]|nr:chemotaxis protein CheC [Clostridiales bacterium]MCF8021697.1 chemotaxis protein CheC [Clostridiales bacterium]
MPNSDLSGMHIDALKEISNIGMGSALTSLAQLVQQKINMSVPNAGFYPVEKVVSLTGGEEKLVSCVSLRVLGDIQGTIMFVFEEESTYLLVDFLMGNPEGSTNTLDDMGKSAVQEVGNVLTGSFINALSSMTQFKMITTVPVFAFDMMGAVITSIMAANGRIEDNVLVIETELFQDSRKVKGNFFFWVDPDYNNILFKALGMS